MPNCGRSLRIGFVNHNRGPGCFLENAAVVSSTCEGRHEGDAGQDLARPFTNAAFAACRTLAPDCMGPWLVWWRQSWPGRKNGLPDDDGAPMKSWWPFLFY